MPQTVTRLEDALSRAYPDKPIEIGQFLQFGSWIGGDRDGNPFVTIDATREALLGNASASLQNYQTALTSLSRQLSIAEAAVATPPWFRAALDASLALCGEEIAARNPGEIFRQFIGCMLCRVEGALGRPAGEVRRTALQQCR